jgi:hypothetical protein
VCGPSELFPFGIAHCIPGGDLLTGACDLDGVRIVGGSVGYSEERPVEIACATENDTCGGPRDCDGECRVVAGAWTCVTYPDGWGSVDEFNFVLEP